MELSDWVTVLAALDEAMDARTNEIAWTDSDEVRSMDQDAINTYQELYDKIQAVVG